MKKNFALAVIALFTITSCSDDSSSENNNNNTDAVLLKKTIETYEDGSSLTTTFVYSGNKLTKENSSDGSRLEYIYSGDKLYRIKFYDETNLLTDEDVYDYDSSGRLSSRLEYFYPLEDGEETTVDRTVYSYNSNSTISYQTFSGDVSSQTNLWDEGTFTLTGGNLVKDESEFSTVVNTYDAKNNPMKNILGYNDFMITYEKYGGVNNFLSYTRTGVYPDQITRTYTYNSGDYPVTAVETHITNGASEETTFQYFYE